MYGNGAVTGMGPTQVEMLIIPQVHLPAPAVLRAGGSWSYDAVLCQVVYRYRSYPSYRGDGVGFRVVSR